MSCLRNFLVHTHAWRVRLLFLLLIFLTGCLQRSSSKPDLAPIDLVDRDAPCDSLCLLTPEELNLVGDQIRLSRRPPIFPTRKYNILALSGGGAYGAYSAGILYGWTESGTRPDFDVITGISTGALIAALAFLGPQKDQELRHFYTTIKNKDIYRIHKPIRSLFSAYIADNAPLAERIRQTVTPEYLHAVASEHARGRRLYVGTTNLNTRRLVVWDMGAIASRGTPEARELFINVLLASTAIPGFFPPVRFPVNVDGKSCEEVHVDGGVSRPIFFRPPYVPPSERAAFGPASLYDSNLYLVIAGKLYPDPQPVRLRALSIASTSISSLLYASGRAEAYRLFTLSVFTGMNYYQTTVPPDFPALSSSVKFDPKVMTRLFEIGRERMRAGDVWRRHPPGLEKAEDVRARMGLNLTIPGPDGCGLLPAPVVPLEMPRQLPPSLPAVEGMEWPFPAVPIIPNILGLPGLPLPPLFPPWTPGIPPTREPIAN